MSLKIIPPRTDARARTGVDLDDRFNNCFLCFFSRITQNAKKEEEEEEEEEYII
jgi:hypothetical protein